jgi:hypothetical protein
MKRSISLGLVVLAGVCAAAAIAAERSYTDDAGDSGTAPDLTNVTVTDSNGFLAFKIAGSLAPSSTIEIFIDTDRNQSTGDDGDELRVGLEQEADGKNYWFAGRWNGTTWERAGIDVQSQSFPGRLEVGFRAADAGITGTFDFVVVAFKMFADAIEARDRAPDSIVPWTYELAPQRSTRTVIATLGQPRLTPARPLPGKQLTVRIPASQGTTTQPLTSGVATCSALVKGRTVRGSASLAGGWASCRLRIPMRTSGTIGRGSLTVGSGATAVSRAFRFRVA